jgi:hypothetical protein
MSSFGRDDNEVEKYTPGSNGSAYTAKLVGQQTVLDIGFPPAGTAKGSGDARKQRARRIGKGSQGLTKPRG